MKQNRAQRPSKRARFKADNREGIYSKTNKETEKIKFKSITKAQLQAIKAQIRKQAKLERTKEKIVCIIFFTSILSMMIWMTLKLY